MACNGVLIPRTKTLPTKLKPFRSKIFNNVSVLDIFTSIPVLELFNPPPRPPLTGGKNHKNTKLLQKVIIEYN